MSIPSVSEGAASLGAPVDAVAAIHAAPVDTMADRAASPPHGGVSHTLTATRGLGVLAAVMGAMLAAMADQIARAIRVPRSRRSTWAPGSRGRRQTHRPRDLAWPTAVAPGLSARP
jgi:hypothetical protein